MLNEIDLEKLMQPLADWYRRGHRHLPWRETSDPYHIWVSEIMLQQTRVEAVIPYYERFLEALPDISSLAECGEDRLLKLWEGLGYYSRVRNMQKAARQMMAEHGGRMPQTYKEILALPGIGPYTAGAVLSIAFGIPRPAVDGNVLRIIARVSDDSSDILAESTKRRVTEALLTVMSPPEEAAGERLSAMEDPGLCNQAMMELGACICIPNGAPKCEDCPWRDACLARQRGTVDRLPVRLKKNSRRREVRTVLVVMDGERVLLRKRPDCGLLAGLYELPNAEGSLSESEVIERVRQVRLDPLYIEALPEAKHIFSHVEWRMRGYLVRVSDAGAFGRDQSEPGVPKRDSPDERVFDEGCFLVERERMLAEYSVPRAFAAYMEYI